MIKLKRFYQEDFDAYYWKLDQVLKNLESRSLTFNQAYIIINRFEKSGKIIESKTIEGQSNERLLKNKEE